MDDSSRSEPIRTLIVDDEPLARERLETLLAPHDDVEIAARAEDGAEAMTAIESSDLDLVFLDVQMPGRSGLDVVEAVGSYAELHTGEETHLIRERMKTLEERLHPEAFMRIHRSTIVRLEEVRAMAPGRASGAVRSG